MTMDTNMRRGAFIGKYVEVQDAFSFAAPAEVLDQASFDHVKVGPTPVLALHNLWRQIHMFLDILEFRVENQKNYLE